MDKAQKTIFDELQDATAVELPEYPQVDIYFRNERTRAKTSIRKWKQIQPKLES